MLVKARWASPIHDLAAVGLFRAFLAFWTRYFSPAAAQHCEPARKTTLRDQGVRVQTAIDSDSGAWLFASVLLPSS